MSVIFLSSVDNELCVCYKDTHHKEPKYTLSHFPTGIRASDFEANYFPLNECEVITQGSAYGVLKKGGHYSRALTLNLKDSGQTKSIKYEEIPIPCPKVKAGIKTRWSEWNARWEKELKKGWCPA